MKGNLPKMGSPQKQQEIKKDLTYKVILIPIVASKAKLEVNVAKTIYKGYIGPNSIVLFSKLNVKGLGVTEPLKKYHDAVAAWFHENRDGRFN